MHTWVCTHGYIHLQGLRLHQLSPFCNRGNRPFSSALAHPHCPITLVAIAPPILSVHISSEMLCPSAATCWSPARVSSLLLSEETPQYSVYSTIPRNGNRVNGNHLDQSLSFPQKNGNLLTWVLVALTVCFTYPVLYKVSAESRAGEWGM